MSDCQDCLRVQSLSGDPGAMCGACRNVLRLAGDEMADLIASWRTLVGDIVEMGDPASHVPRLEVRDFRELFALLDRWRALVGGGAAGVS